MSNKDVDSKLQELQAKMAIEKKVFEAAASMLSKLTDKNAREQCEINVIESQRRLEFLEAELSRLTLKKQGVDTDSSTSLAITIEAPTGVKTHSNNRKGPAALNINLSDSTSQLSSISSTSIWKKKTIEAISASQESLRGNSKENSKHSLFAGLFKSQKSALSSSALTPKLLAQSMGSLNSVNSNKSTEIVTSFDALKFNTTLTSEKLKYRIEHIREKLEFENKVTAGTENLLTAMLQSSDSRTKTELEAKLKEAKDKIAFLKKSEQKYCGLYVTDDQDDDKFYGRAKKTGRLKIELLGATNIPGRRSSDETFFAVLRVDGTFRGNTRATTGTFGEYYDIQVDKANEIEVALYDAQTRNLMSLSWFTLSDLEMDLKCKYGDNYYEKTKTVNDVEEIWLDMEPSGQLLLKICFLAVARSKTQADQVFRRNPVQKVYPRNDHKFIAQQSYTIMQCAVCTEILSGQCYQCRECQYICHPRCYQGVITKCITSDEVKKAKAEKKGPNSYNTGQLLKYNIPHRFESSVNLSAAWCSHCGSMLPVGRKVHRCSECGISAHKQCCDMVPNFCGLKPDTAKLLVQAFEEHERKMHHKELEEAERQRSMGFVSPTQQNIPNQIDFSNSNTLQIGGLPVPARGQSLQNLNKVNMPTHDGQQPYVPNYSNETLNNRPNVPSQPQQASIVSPTMAMPVPQPKESAVKTEPTANLIPKLTLDKQILPLSKEQVKLDDFDLLAVLGRGAFGKVMLVSERKTKGLYAMKALKKEFIIQNDDVKSTKLEKRVFQAASATHHPFLVNLHSCFQTETRIYFVMEYVSGGDLMAHMMAQKRFSPIRVKFYACEVLLALEYLHQANIVYRDLKLENILMTPEGHIKLADYGICKENMGYGAVTRTFCGTPDYMAPEILLNQKYGRAVDWWSFGVFIFVMIAGRYPFHGQDDKDVLDAILSDFIPWPSSIPKDVKEFIQALLIKNPNRRLGGGKLDAEEVKRHAYFQGTNWNDFIHLKVAPSWKPNIAHPTDVSNFDEEFTSEKPVLTPMQSILSRVDQENFSDFNYVSEWAITYRQAQPQVVA